LLAAAATAPAQMMTPDGENGALGFIFLTILLAKFLNMPEEKEIARYC
jgi:hypothetical protein